MNKIIKFSLYIINIIVMSLILPVICLATPSQPTIERVSGDLNGDLFQAKSSSDVTLFMAGTSQSKASYTYQANSGVSYLSLPNGNFYVWAKNSSGQVSSPTLISVTDSCSNISASNATGSGTVERCYLTDGTNMGNGTLATCASGYYFAVGPTYITYNDCGRKDISILSKRFCTKKYDYTCTKTAGSTAVNSKLADLSIDGLSLTPSFSADTTTYRASTTESSIKVNATLQNPNANFADGYGPRSVDLKSGANYIYVKTTSSSGGSSYLIIVTRNNGTSGGDTKSTNNYLNSLSIDGVSISPSFSSKVIGYTGSVDSSVSEVTINAELADSSASFVDGFGPRKVTLSTGNNNIRVKVKSEAGVVRTYSLAIVKADSTGETPTTNSNPLLSSLEISSGTIAFDPNTFDYNATVDYSVTNIVTTAKSSDDTNVITVNGGDNLAVGEDNIITITVSNADGSAKSTYTIYVIRKEENITISNNSLLSDLAIVNHKIKFDAKTTEYSVTLNQNETELDISATPSDEKSSITVEGNDNLTVGSEIKIRVTAEDGTYTDYFVKIEGSKKGGNVFLTIFVVLLIILVLAYLVLRAMGYKIYFNFEAIKDFIKNLFHKND